MIRFTIILCLLSLVSSFTVQPLGMRAPTKVGMFSKDDKPAGLSEMSTEDSADVMAASTMDEEKTPVRNLVKDMNTGEIKEVAWVDPAMAANTNPLEMSWWAYILFGLPPILLLNDAFHFLPTDGPLGMLGRL